MEKHIIVALNEKKIINKIDKKIFNYKSVQYREAILEILYKTKNIDYIIIDEKISGEISIEELIKKIKKINNKIIIFFILEKTNIKKENKLKKLGIKNIYNNIKNLNKILEKIKNYELKEIKNINNKNNLNNKNYEISENTGKEKNKIKDNKKIENKLKNKIIKLTKIKNNKKLYNKINNKKIKQKNIKENKIITIYGEKNSGKTTISNLIIYNLIKKDKNILLINLNKKIDNNYLILLKNRYYISKNRSKNNKINFNIKREEKKIENIIQKEIENYEIKINKNLTFIYGLSQVLRISKEEEFIKDKEKLTYFFNKYILKYDYVVVDIGKIKYSYIETEFIKKSYKKIIVCYKNILGIKDLQEIIRKNKNDEEVFDTSLHIIQNKYFLYSVSSLIIKNIFRKNVHIHKIFYNKNYQELTNKILKNEKIKIPKYVNKKIDKILQ